MLAIGGIASVGGAVRARCSNNKISRRALTPASPTAIGYTKKRAAASAAALS